MQEFDECIKQIDKVLDETEGLCEYAIYVKALIMRHRGVARGCVTNGAHSKAPLQQSTSGHRAPLSTPAPGPPEAVAAVIAYTYKLHRAHF